MELADNCGVEGRVLVERQTRRAMSSGCGFGDCSVGDMLHEARRSARFGVAPCRKRVLARKLLVGVCIVSHMGHGCACSPLFL